MPERKDTTKQVWARSCEHSKLGKNMGFFFSFFFFWYWAYTLSPLEQCIPPALFILFLFKIESCKLFARAGFEPQSS
jgi:hypothetical protein